MGTAPAADPSANPPSVCRACDNPKADARYILCDGPCRSVRRAPCELVICVQRVFCTPSCSVRPVWEMLSRKRGRAEGSVCAQWYHYSCAGLAAAPDDMAGPFVCANCTVRGRAPASVACVRFSRTRVRRRRQLWPSCQPVSKIWFSRTRVRRRRQLRPSCQQVSMIWFSRTRVRRRRQLRPSCQPSSMMWLPTWRLWRRQRGASAASPLTLKKRSQWTRVSRETQALLWASSCHCGARALELHSVWQCTSGLQ